MISLRLWIILFISLIVWISSPVIAQTCNSATPNGPFDIPFTFGGGFVDLGPFVLPTATSQVISKLSITPNDNSGATINYRLGLYDNNFNLIAQTAQQTIVNFAGGLLISQLMVPVLVLAGQTYYVAFQSDTDININGINGGPFESIAYDPASLPTHLTNIVIGAELGITYYYGCTGTTGDPSFVGILGQEYQVHGMADEVYNLISDTKLQENSLFVFLESGQCPTFTERMATNCWSHPGSYLGGIGLQIISHGNIQQLLILAGDKAQGFYLVNINGKVLQVNDSVSLVGMDIHFNDSHLVTVATELFNFVFENSDHFINQAVSVNVPIASLKSHGLLGQTHVYKPKNSHGFIEGHVDDYLIEDRDMFGNRFIFNRFQM